MNMKKLFVIIVCLVCCCATATSQQRYSLKQIKDSALHNNMAIRSAKYNIEAAQQQRKEAFTKFFPNVSGTGLVSMMKNGTIAGVQAVQPVFAGGQIINGNKLAKVGEDVSKLQLQLSENEVEKTAEQYFWQLASLQEKMKTIDAVDTLLRDIYKDVDVAIRAGVALRNDLLRVQLRQNEIASQRLKLQNGLSLVRLLLSQYCGLRDTSFVITY